MELEYKYYGKNQIKQISAELFDKIINHNKEFVGVSWGQMMFNYLNNIKTPQKCECGNHLKFFKFNKGYSRFCSQKCRAKSETLKNEIKESFLKKYGVDNPLKSKEVQLKRKKSTLEKRGVEHHSQSIEVIEKKKQTNLKRYGVPCIFLDKNTQKKIKENNLKKYGFEHHSQLIEVIEKKKQTNLKKYGVSCNFLSDENRIKTKQTNIRRYGVEHSSQSENIRKKQRDTWLKNKHEKLSKIINHPMEKIVVDNQELTIFDYCKKHPIFKITKNQLHQRWFKYGRKICTKCNPISAFDSISENSFAEFFNELNVDVIRNDRALLNNGLELDVYLPNEKLAFEFDGLYWHGDYFKDQNYHLDKTKQCEDKGIQLIHVFEDEWLHKQEIVKSIIKARLGFFEEKYYARKCEIKEINNNKLIKDFLNENHIQGFVGSRIAIGLFYLDELVSIMCFGKKRIAMGIKENTDSDYELLRYCTKQNTLVVGGVSKMLSYFKKTYKPKTILSYADRRYSTGELYKKMGFSFIGETKPNYWYFKPNELIRYYRFGFRKNILIKEGFDSNKTEKEIMCERGFHRIYDCGNKKYILNNTI